MNSPERGREIKRGCKEKERKQTRVIKEEKYF